MDDPAIASAISFCGLVSRVRVKILGSVYFI